MNPGGDLERTLAKLDETLRGLGVSYHCTGGLVSSFYGEPRLTRDVDVVLRPPQMPDGTERLIHALQPGFLIDPALVRRAIGEKGMFQALDRKTLVKIDFHVGEAVPGELGRSAMEELLPGLTLPLVSREDAILSKLLWARKGSEQSRRDAAAMVRAGELLDWTALHVRAEQLGIQDLLEDVRRNTTG